MSRFVQLHILTPYHPSNLNRDDLNRPKTAYMGEALRLRVSSQSLKRAWRTSELFQQSFSGSLGVRTKELGKGIYDELLAGGVAEKKALAWSRAMAGKFGKLKKETDKNPTEIEQLCFVTPEEKEAVKALTQKLIETGEDPSDEDLMLLRKSATAVDVAMFGRMLASDPVYNVEAAVQVAHAVTVNQATVEDDFFTAVDDLNQGIEDVGAGHMGEFEFGSGVFYLYICCDCAQLKKNLNGDAILAGRALAALAEAAATVAPGGKQASFASRSYAQYILAEKGDKQPRSLAAAFFKPVKHNDPVPEAIKALCSMRDQMDACYGPLAQDTRQMCVPRAEGSLADILAFIKEAAL